MKKLMSIALGLSLLAPVATFAQKKPVQSAEETSKGTAKGKKGKAKGTDHKAKSKKGSGGSTTPPPK